MTTLPDFSDPCLPLPARSDDAPWASHAWVLAPLVRAGQTFTDLKGSRWVGQRLLHLPLRPPSITGASAGPAARLLFACLAVLLVALVAAIPGVRPRLDPTAPQAAVTETVSSRAPLTLAAVSAPAAPSTSPTSSISPRLAAPSTSPRLAAPPVLSPAPSTSLPLGLVAPAASPRLPRLHARAPLPAPLPSKPWPRVRVLALDPPAAHEDELGLLPIPMPSSDVEAQG